MGKKKETKKRAKKVARKEVRKLLGVEGTSIPHLANPRNQKQELESQNPYLVSLYDPFNKGAGSKIPGFGLLPTATLSVWDRRTLTVNAQGVVGVFLQGMMPGLVDGINVGQPFSAGWILGTAATTTNLFQSFTTAGVGPSNLLLGNDQTGTTIDQTYQDLRPVSGGIGIVYTGTTLNDAGVFVGASYPRESGALSWPGTSNLSLANFRNSPYAREVPVNKHEMLMVKYRPSDSASFNFYRTGTRGYPINGNISAVNTNWSDGFGSLAVVGAGLTAGQSVTVYICINYEAHPEPASTTIVGVSPSHQDPLALAHASNVISSAQMVVASPSSSAPDNPNLNQLVTQHTEENKPKFLDKAMSLVNSVEKGVASAAGVAAKAAPLLALL